MEKIAFIIEVIRIHHCFKHCCSSSSSNGKAAIISSREDDLVVVFEAVELVVPLLRSESLIQDASFRSFKDFDDAITDHCLVESEDDFSHST